MKNSLRNILAVGIMIVVSSVGLYAGIIEEQRANVLSNNKESLEATKKIKEAASIMDIAVLGQ